MFQKERHLQKKADKRKVLKKYFFQKKVYFIPNCNKPSFTILV